MLVKSAQFGRKVGGAEVIAEALEAWLGGSEHDETEVIVTLESGMKFKLIADAMRYDDPFKGLNISRDARAKMLCVCEVW